MAKLNPNVFASFLSRPAPARATSSSRVAIEASAFTPPPSKSNPNPQPINTITINMPERKPRAIGAVKTAQVMTLTPQQREAAKLLPQGLLEVPSDVIEFMHAHAAEVAALSKHLGIG